ncbi:MAG TPA: hypothetical protein VEQ42_09470 [Pyrinomonadaceae bacterium]|nr:hypothetical protein [Pyrinomonadaceae bacterium]
MVEKISDTKEIYKVAAHEARVAAARAREAADAFEAFAEQLTSGDYGPASEAHLRAVDKLAAADDAAAACDDWLTKSGDSA